MAVIILKQFQRECQDSWKVEFPRGGGIRGEKVKLCHCNKCSFSFYDRRLTEKEGKLLYSGYRSDEYQKMREQYDCWYTKRVNDALNNDESALKEQQRVIEKILFGHIHSKIKVALDYGGNEGKTYSKRMGIGEKYVYDISDVPTVEGVKRVEKYDDLYDYNFDLIMCNMVFEHESNPKDLLKKLYDIGTEETFYYIEVPSENPFDKNKFSVLKNISLLTNKYTNIMKLVKHYFNLKKLPYMPMTEHINFFTPKAMEQFMIQGGFKVVTIEENIEKGVLGKGKVLSVLAKKIAKRNSLFLLA